MADSQQQQHQAAVLAAAGTNSLDNDHANASADSGSTSTSSTSLSASNSSHGQAQQQQQQQQPKDSRGRWIRIVVASIKAVLFLELAGMVTGPLIASKTRRRRSSSDSDEDSGSDLDPADVLMDYLTGRTSLAALQMLRNDQLSAAVDNLVTEDFAELGVNDRGREIRSIVDEIIQAREKGIDTVSSRQQKQQQRQSEGLGKVGPLRFRNSKTAIAKAVPSAAAADADKEQPVDSSSSTGSGAAIGKQ